MNALCRFFASREMEIAADEVALAQLHLHFVFTKLASRVIATYAATAQPSSICRPGSIGRMDNNSREVPMVHTASGAPFRVSTSPRRLTKLKLTWLGAAASLAAISVLGTAPDAHARITNFSRALRPARSIPIVLRMRSSPTFSSRRRTRKVMSSIRTIFTFCSRSTRARATIK
jgi:hypothetical protein